MSDLPRRIELPLTGVFEDVESEPILLANAFAVSGDAEGQFYLTIGQVAPPILQGSPQEQQFQAQGIKTVPIRAVVRLAISPGKMDELVSLLISARDQVKTMQQQR